MMDTALREAVTSRRADDILKGPCRATHKVTFLPLNVTVEVDDSKYPLADHGEAGLAAGHRARQHIKLEHNCGGSCACTTCHVVVREGEENLSTMEQDEEDRLDTAEGLTLHSRSAVRPCAGRRRC